MKYIELKKALRSAIFSRQDLRMLGGRFYNWQISYWQKKGLIVKIKNGLYAFSDNAHSIQPEEIAPLIYSPSYISLEKALSVYGLIPEMTYAVTCVTPKATRRFRNTWGVFSYRHVKPSLFFGYHEAGSKMNLYLIADPEKALLDYLYFNLSGIKTAADIKELRLNLKAIRSELSRKKLARSLLPYGSKRMDHAVDMIMGEK
jgi:predicted transcriptional regulator of viral defense system